MALRPRINEFLFDQTGTDVNEYIELKADPNTDLSQFQLVLIEGDNGSTLGNITYSAAAGTTDSNGYWWTGYLPTNTLQNGTQTLLLVTGYTPGTTDVDTNNDGVLDVTPWTSIVD